MKRTLMLAMMLGGIAVPGCAWACGGPAGAAVALSYNGSTYTVTNISKVPLQVTFAAFGTTYSMSLAPGQSGVPQGGGLFNLPMHGYQSCTAVVVPTR
ncbi:MAG: hypothetical protein ABSD74_15350 [Rhizomicrobium sp.]|jgi:hypothetical protein